MRYVLDQTTETFKPSVRTLINGSGSIAIVITCDSAFAGQLVTATMGSTVYTQLCPTTSPYTVVFQGVSSGQWTISCTLNEEEFTTIINVQDVSGALNYSLQWQDWVDLSRTLSSSDFNSLQEVIEDEEAVRQLFLVHDCVDYLASVVRQDTLVQTIIENDLCAKWINLSDYALDTLAANPIIKGYMDTADKYFYGEWALVGQVPTMTSNTAPYGEAFESSEYQSVYTAFKAFDGGSDYPWIPSTSDTLGNCYVGYKFIKPTCIKRIQLYTVINPTITRISAFKLQASNTGDSNDWEDLLVVTNREDGLTYYDVENDTNYLYYRILITDGVSPESTALAVTSLQFYAWQPKGNVPIMTANDAPYGTAISSAQYSGYYAYSAFDNNDSTATGDNSSSATSGSYVGYSFVNPTNIRKVKVSLAARSTTRTNTVKIQYSDDNSSWNDATTEAVTISTSNIVNEIEVEDSGYHLHWRIYKVSSSIADRFPLASLQFYGRELKDLVPPMISNTLPSGEASASHETYPAYYSFNKNFSTTSGWYTYEHTVTDEWLKYKFDSQVDVKFIKLTLTAASNTSHAYKSIFQGSNDDNTWEDITDELSYTIAGTSTMYTYFQRLITDNPYQYYRLKFTYSDATGAQAITPWIIEIQIYGKDYSEKEFEAGATKKWLYDHGVELGEFEEVSSANGYSRTSYTFVSPNYSFDHIALDATTSAVFCAIAGAFETPPAFNLLLAKTVARGYTTAGSVNTAAALAIYSSKVLDTSIGATGVTVPQLSQISSLDTSNANNALVYLIACGIQGRAIDLYELWLE